MFGYDMCVLYYFQQFWPPFRCGFRPTGSSGHFATTSVTSSINLSVKSFTLLILFFCFRLRYFSWSAPRFIFLLYPFPLPLLSAIFNANTIFWLSLFEQLILPIYKTYSKLLPSSYFLKKNQMVTQLVNQESTLILCCFKSE